MASVAHLAAGAVCGAAYARATDTKATVAVPAFAALALAPDLDFFAMSLDPAGTPLEHRAMTHALPFAGVAAVALAAVVPSGGRRALVGLLCFVAIASHGVLDAMTSIGNGPRLFWPFLDAPIHAAWRPIPGTSSFQDYFSTAGWPVMTKEALMCTPLLVATWLLLSRGGEQGVGESGPDARPDEEIPSGATAEL